MRFLPLIGIGGIAAIALASRGKKKKPSQDIEIDEIDEIDDAEEASSASARPRLKDTPETREIQEVLHELGYGNIVGDIDGKKGSNTKAAIRAFQGDYRRWSEKRKSIKVDGIWGGDSSDAADHALRALNASGRSSFSDLVGGRSEAAGPAGSAGAVSSAEMNAFLQSVFDELSECLERGDVQESSSGLYGTVSNYAKAAQCIFNMLSGVGANVSQMTESEKEEVGGFVQTAVKRFMGAVDRAQGNLSAVSRSQWVSDFRRELGNSLMNSTDITRIARLWNG
jgi:hypothetical protein